MNNSLQTVQKELVDAVSGEQLLEFTKNIAKEVRLSGSEEELRAFHYVKEQLEQFGLETELTFHDAYISIPLSAEIRVKDKVFPCITHAMAPSTDGIEKEIIYCADLQNLNHLDGKIILLEGIATPGAVQQLEKAGASGAIFINGKHTHEMIVSTVWGNPTPTTKLTYPNLPVVSVVDEVGDELKEYISTHAQSPVWLKTKVDTGWRKIPTLIAELKGEVEPEKFVLFSGHIDSWHYGAMDNAGANATMLEVARIITQQKVQLRRGLRLAFWSGHSHGRYTGSAHYCDTHWEDLHENCILHVYVDSVGGKGANILGEANCMRETRELGGRFVESLTGETFIGKRFGSGGDQSFWGTGIPSLFMGLSEQPKGDDPASKTLVKLFGGIKSGGFGWWWHTTEDTLDKLDKDNLERDCRIYTATIHESCTSQLLPLQHSEAAREIKEALVNYQKKAGYRFDLSRAIDRVDQLIIACSELEQNLAEVSLTEENVKYANDVLLKLSRYLVPLNYVSGDEYEYDPAMNQPPVPTLSGILKLATLEIESEEFLEWKTLLVRKLNKVNYTLIEAIRVAECLNEKLRSRSSN